jgi:arsenite-transporting ATPase
VLTGIEEQLSGACTVEIAAFDEFTALLAGPAATEAYDHVVFDTAPTGHTLRLLSLPRAWDHFISTNTLGTSCLGPLSGLANQRDRYRCALATLADRAQTVLVLVSRPDVLALGEAARAARELKALGIANQRLVVNGVFQAGVTTDPLAVSLAAQATEALAALPAELAGLVRDEVPLVAWSPVGVAGLRSLLVGDPPEQLAGPVGLMVAAPAAGTASLAELVDQVAERGRGLVLTMGKGGVGKTTLAAGIAVELARRGHPVDLTTTDPAAHVAAVMGADAGGLSTLRVTRIDPEQVTAAYTAEVLAEAGAGMDAPARAVLEEDLRSPCTVEIAVFRAFARKVASATDRFVVLDTAPTGHTLLLLDATRAYHREVGRQGGGAPPEVETLLDRLTDPAFTSVFIVTLPEATPVHEAASLQEDLRRAGIEPAAWIVNQSLEATAVTDPVLVARASAEVRYIGEVATRHASRVAIVPLLAEAPTGAAGVALLFGATAVART